MFKTSCDTCAHTGVTHGNFPGLSCSSYLGMGCPGWVTSVPITSQQQTPLSAPGQLYPGVCYSCADTRSLKSDPATKQIPCIMAGCLGVYVVPGSLAAPYPPPNTNYSIPLSAISPANGFAFMGANSTSAGEESSKPSGMVRELAEALIAEFDYCGIPGGYASIHKAIEALRAELEK